MKRLKLELNVKLREMKKSRFTEPQIIKILGEQDQGKTVSEICRAHGISQPTFYSWKSKYSGMSVSQLKKMNGVGVRAECIQENVS